MTNKEILTKHIQWYFDKNPLSRFDDIPNSVFIDAMEEYKNQEVEYNCEPPVDEIYTQHYLDWRNKYFFLRPKTYLYKSKSSDRELTLIGIHKFYKQAFKESPCKTK